ncbi:hypothetical protein Afil01_07510 [Actinorhabdospora filicis]|uniref:Uncharacterized protein n=1 Tax=Actinorhabdospora filicis TaxID=1785913 RepID=A0A9W6SEY3_9ACTN|nr:DUF6190 family protein [Actinorhabdospora filicis]GLZ75944.1 hypothetical protein Afil01_07510 [Actinorhabdospora filicis]
MPGEVIIDAALFMGMHAADEATRLACKKFFADGLSSPVVMPLEQVGLCDDLIWRLPRDVQDAYYPFMDNLHSIVPVERPGYERDDIDAAFETRTLDGLPTRERLLLGFTLNRGGILRTPNQRLLNRAGLPVAAPPEATDEPRFPDELEKLYLTSLRLRVPGLGEE